MSFFNSCRQDRFPGHIRGNPLSGLNERVCIQVKRVFDACIQQITKETLLSVDNIRPFEAGLPLTFVSAKNLCSQGIIENLSITRLNERSRFARVQCDVNIPVEVIFDNADGFRCKGDSVIVVHEDVVLHIPEHSIIPFTVEAVTSANCPEGTYSGEYQFNTTDCITIILKVVVEAELLVPSYGYCAIPPANEYDGDICTQFYDLPLFPRNGN